MFRGITGYVKGVNPNVLRVAISLGVWGVGEGMFFYFQSIYLENLGVSKTVLGLLLGLSGLFMALSHTPAGYLSDRIGPRPVMWGSWFLGIISCGIMAVSGSLEVFLLGMFIYSTTAFGMAPMNSYLSRMRGEWSVARALTFCSAVYNVGAILGPMLGGMIAEQFNIPTIYKIATLVFIVSTGVILTIQRLPAEHHSGAGPNGHILQNQRFLVFLGMVFATQFALYLPQALTPNYLQFEHGLSNSQIGQIGSITNLGNAVIMILLGNLVPGKGVLIGQALVILYNLLLWRGSEIGWFALGSFFASGHRLSRSMLMAFVRPFLRDSQLGLAFGLVETVNGLTVLAAPSLAGLLYDHSAVLPYQVSLMLIALTLIANMLLLPRLHRPQPQPIPPLEVEDA